MVTPANNALFVINGKSRTVNCEIGGVHHPTELVWTINRTHNYATDLMAPSARDQSTLSPSLHND